MNIRQGRSSKSFVLLRCFGWIKKNPPFLLILCHKLCILISTMVGWHFRVQMRSSVLQFQWREKLKFWTWNRWREKWKWTCKFGCCSTLLILVCFVFFIIHPLTFNFSPRKVDDMGFERLLDLGCHMNFSVSLCCYIPTDVYLLL